MTAFLSVDSSLTGRLWRGPDAALERSAQALAQDLADAVRLIPNASIDWLIDGLVMLPEERRPELLAKVQALLAAHGG